MVSEKIFEVFAIISLWELMSPWAWPIWTKGHGWQDLCRGPLNIATSKEKIFEVFPIVSLWELYMGMVAILIYGQFIQIFNPPLTQSST